MSANPPDSEKRLQLHTLLDELQHQKGVQSLDRKTHWQKYRQAVHLARHLSSTQLEEDVVTLLDQIDHHFFQTWGIPKFSIFWVNIFVLVTVLIVEILYWVGLPSITDVETALLVFIGVSFFFFFLSHCFFHWAVGTLLGIRFRQYFVFRSSFRKVNIFPITILTRFPVLGIKYELGSFLRASRWRRTLMLGAVPFLTSGWFLLHYFPLYQLFAANPLVSLIGGLVLLGIIGSLVASFFFYGDLWKARQDWK